MNNEVKDNPVDNNYISEVINEVCKVLMIKGNAISSISEGNIRYLHIKYKDENYCLIYSKGLGQFVGLHRIHI